MTDTELNSELSNQFEADLLSELVGCKDVTMSQDTYLSAAGSTICYTSIVLSGSIKVTRSDSSGKYNLRLLDILSLVDAIAFQSVDQRLISFLQNKKKSDSKITITHQEIANQLGTV